MIEKRLGLVFALLLSHTLFAKDNVAPPVSVQAETLKESWAVGWWLPRHEEIVKRVAKGNVDLLMIGDRQGYRIWAEAMEPTIKKLMGE